MAPRHRHKFTNSASASAPWWQTHADDAYIAKVDTANAIRRHKRGDTAAAAPDAAAPDAVAGWIADQQLGLITAVQAALAGLSRTAITRRRRQA